jgi:hypothetical protein
VLHERLGAALRTALAEQMAMGTGFDQDALAEAVRVRIGDAIRNDITEGIRERVREALRDRLGEAIRNAVSQGAPGAETTGSGPFAGVH